MRKLANMNRASIIKLMWKIKSGDNSLWCQALKGKYAKNYSGINKVDAKAYDSSLWKWIFNVWPSMEDMTFWTISSSELVSSTMEGFTEAQENVKVSELTDDNGNWNVV